MNLGGYLSPGMMSDLRTAGAALLTSFVLAHLIGVVYVWSHRSLSFSNSFVQALVMGSVVTATMMLAIGNNMVWGIGVVGALALVRFRTTLRDTRDIMFIFASLVTGIACGTRSFGLAALGAVIFCLIAMYLAHFPFAARKSFDGLLRFTATWSGSTMGDATEAMRRNCKNFVLATIRDAGQGEWSEHVYHVNFRSDDARQQLARELSTVEGLTGVELLIEETRQEP